MVNTQKAVYFICDRRACLRCTYPYCQYTTDIRHAVNFVSDASGCHEVKLSKTDFEESYDFSDSFDEEKQESKGVNDEGTGNTDNM